MPAQKVVVSALDRRMPRERDLPLVEPPVRGHLEREAPEKMVVKEHARLDPDETRPTVVHLML